MLVPLCKDCFFLPYDKNFQLKMSAFAWYVHMANGHGQIPYNIQANRQQK